MFKCIYEHPQNNFLQSYLGLLSHGDALKVRQKLLNWYGLWAEQEE
ncbi:hypothetical protein HY798_02980 [Candidatus Falkowbacteria bacterium]|nr:hypothetical protein [Candidatus Falkowbacteria bacterium]